MDQQQLTHLPLFAGVRRDRYGRVQTRCGHVVPERQLAGDGDPTCDSCFEHHRQDERDRADFEAMAQGRA